MNDVKWLMDIQKKICETHNIVTQLTRHWP